MGLGQIRGSGEVADTRAAHRTNNPKPTLDFSAFERANRAIAESLNLRGKALAAWAGTVNDIADAVGGSAKEYSRYAERMARAEQNRKSAGQELSNAKAEKKQSENGSGDDSWLSFFGF